MKSKDPEATPDTSIRFSDFMNRPFAICCILMCGHEVNGVFTMVNYAKIIFKESGSPLDPGKSAIAVVFLQLLGCLVSSLLIERLGRKVRNLQTIISNSIILFVPWNWNSFQFLIIGTAFDSDFVCWGGRVSNHFGHIHLPCHINQCRFDRIPFRASGCFFSNDIHCFMRCHANPIRHSRYAIYWFIQSECYIKMLMIYLC